MAAFAQQQKIIRKAEFYETEAYPTKTNERLAEWLCGQSSMTQIQMC